MHTLLVKLRALYNIIAERIGLDILTCACSDFLCAEFGFRHSSSQVPLLQRPHALHGS